ncbi:MAG: AMP-binding protein [Clostridia bacterium]|nr:AMP-binding protein [Clostridia bacterium]
MSLVEKYAKCDFDSYEEFYKNFKLNIPEKFNFAVDIVDEWARIEPEKIALIWCNDKGEERKATFCDIRDESMRAANYFKSLGYKKGERVMVVLKRHYEFWPIIVALHRIGMVAIPATHLLTEKDFVYRFECASVSHIIVSGEGNIASRVDSATKQYHGIKTRVCVREAHGGWSLYDDAIQRFEPHFAPPVGEDEVTKSDISLLYFTSGTTGYPKMVCHDFAYPLSHIVTSKFWQCVRENTLHLTVSETGWAKSVWGKLYGQWICGAGVFVYDYSDHFTPIDLIHKIEKYRVTTFCAPPTIYRFLIKEDLARFDLSSLKYCAIAGEPLNPEIYNKFLEITGLKLHEGFGQTESVVSLANWPWIEPRPGSMGKPAPYYDVVLMRDDGEECEPGETGQLCYRLKDEQHGLFCGYFNNPELNSLVIHDGYYWTGDLAWCDEDGYYWYVGRADDIIKSSGYRIGPFEVESALMEHPAVLETAITAVPDEIRGQVVKATIVLAKGYTASEELKKELQNHVKQSTAPYKYPRVVEFVDELPKTISGKIRRKKIRDVDSGTTSDY